MKKPKCKYYVCYRNHYNYGDGRIDADAIWTLLGSTYAVSPAKAVSNVRFRKDVHHLANQYHEWAYDGMRYVEFKAFTEFEFNCL